MIRFLGQNAKSDDGILVFLPGIASIEEVYDQLIIDNSTQDVSVLHSTITVENQANSISTSSKKQKVVLATNLAESTLTISNITYVIDTCLAKVVRWNPETQSVTLEEVFVCIYLFLEFICLDAARQRMGRCGRLCSGTVLRFVTEVEFSSFLSTSTPEICRAPLEDVGDDFFFFFTFQCVVSVF